MDLQEIEGKLNDLFEGSDRKIVFWYDDDAAYEGDIDSLQLSEGIKVFKLTGSNNFEAKLLLENGKYIVDYDGYKVTLSDEKQARLKENNVQPQDVTLGVRPDHMVVGKDGIEGSVDVSELMGSAAHLHMTVNGRDVIVVIPTNDGYVDYVGQNLKLGFTGNLVHLFAKTGSERNLEFLNDNSYMEDPRLLEIEKEEEKVQTNEVK